VHHGESIQGAINRSSPGDTILVAGGIYCEQITIDRRITLLGLSRPIIDGEGKDGSVVIVTADSITVKGFTICNSGSRIFYNDSGLKLFEMTGGVITDNQFLDNNYGVYLQNAANCVISDNVFYGRADYKTEETTGDGIHLWKSPGNRVEANRIQKHRDGIYVEFSPHTTVVGNRVAHVIRYGLHYMYSNDNVYENNVFEENRTGSALMYSKNIKLQRNVFQRNRGSRAFGILFKDCNDSVIEENLFLENTTGIFMDGSNRNRFRHNLIAHNGWALDLFTSSMDNVFVENNFIDNDFDLLLDTKRNPNRFYEGTMGNYWSSYRGYDLDNDGIGDVPYQPLKYFSLLAKRYPDLSLLTGGLIVQALQWAERSFPVLEVKGVDDPYPLIMPLQVSAPLEEETKPRMSLLLICLSSLVVVVALGVMVRSAVK